MCIQVVQPWEICPGAVTGLVETVSLFLYQVFLADGRVEKCQKTGKKDSLPGIPYCDSAEEISQPKQATQKYSGTNIGSSICEHW